MSPLLLDEILGAIRREPRRRAELIREHARKIGVPVSRVHRHLLAAGHGSGRKRRSDAGATKVSAEALDMLSAALKSGVRQSGQAPLGIPMARFALEANGFDFGGASNAQLARLLRERGLDLDTQARGTRSHQRMRSAHPNQVHQVDPSVSLLYYTPGGRQGDAGVEPGGEPYKNKPANKKLKLWRYLLIDHGSGCFFLYYYEASGETSANLWDFMCRAWEPKPDAFHGLPDLLVWDPGSANASQPIARALDALEVETHAHLPGSAETKGGVESAHWLVEQRFESLLRLQPVESIEDLNALALRWATACCANAIAGLDCRLHRRTGAHVRYEAWQRIQAEQLRELPAEAWDLPAHQPVERKVAGGLTVTLRHPRLKARAVYAVGGLPGVKVGAKVELQPLLMSPEGAAFVRYRHQGELAEQRVEPVEHDEIGTPMTATTWGEYQARPRTDAERESDRIDALIGREKPTDVPFGGEVRAIDALSAAIDAGADGTVVPFPRRGKPQEIEPAQPAAVLGTVEAARYVRDRLGDAWHGDLFSELCQRWPRGAAKPDLDAWTAELGRQADVG
ncbi:MAG: transposase [Spirochaetaceae bacterium]|nr:transposase [Spirochaetaceae bacterium]